MTNSTLKTLHKALITILFGTALEYYDLALFAFIAPMLAESFLPELQPSQGAMVMFLTYGIGSIARPLGSYVFGFIGDKYGRVKPLYFTMCSMAVLSAIISITPGYQTFGIYSLVIFTALRMLQQFFVSGHFNGGAIYCLEHSEGIYKPGLISGIYNAATVAGIVFAAFMATLIAHFGSEFWRIGYIIGAFGALLSLLMRRHLIETPIFLKSKPTVFSSTSDSRKTNIKFSISITLVSLLFGVLYAFSAKVLNVIIPEVSSFNLDVVLSTNLYVIVCYFFLLVFFGYTADIIGVKKQMIVAALLAIPVTFFITRIEYTSIAMIFIAKFVVITLVAMLFGPAHSYFISELAVHKRYKMISILFTIGKVISSFTPAIFLYLWNNWKNLNYISLYISIIAVFTILNLIYVGKKN